MYLPSQEELNRYKSLANNQYANVRTDTRLRGAKKPIEEDDRVSLARLLAAVNLLNSLGALDPVWLEKQWKLTRSDP